MFKLKKKKWWEFPGCSVVRVLGSHCHGPGSIPGEPRFHELHGMANKRVGVREFCWFWLMALMRW